MSKPIEDDKLGAAVEALRALNQATIDRLSTEARIRTSARELARFIADRVGRTCGTCNSGKYKVAPVVNGTSGQYRLMLENDNLDSQDVPLEALRTFARELLAEGFLTGMTEKVRGSTDEDTAVADQLDAVLAQITVRPE